MRRTPGDARASSFQWIHEALASIDQGLIIWDSNDCVAAWNERVFEIFPHLREFIAVGVSARLAFARAIAAAEPHLTPAEQAAWVERRMSQRRQGGTIELTPPDGRVVEITEQRTPSGGFVSMYRDVTQRRQEQRELERALAAERALNLQQRRFVSIASHEFRTPLAIILSAAQRIESRLAGTVPADCAIRFQRIHAAIGRMGDLIERMLSSAQNDEGRLTPQRETVDIVAILREAIDRQATITPAMVIAMNAPTARTMVEADPRLLDQIFANLLSNAAKYSGRSRAIQTSVASAPGIVSIAVRDSGIGISPEDLPQLFSRFFRAGTAQGIAGTGIGLHLVRSLVDAHGGRITVESEVGKGSTFTVHLPTHRPDAVAA